MVYKRMEEDGIIEETPEHWETYTAKVRNISRTYAVTIPIDIARHLQLKKGDSIQVAIKRREDILPFDSGYSGLKYLNEPPKPHPRKLSKVRRAIDAFLASNMPYAELPFKYKSVRSFLRRNPEYKDKIRLHVTGYGKPEQKVWVERLKKEEELMKVCVNCPSYRGVAENAGYCDKYRFLIYLSLAERDKICERLDIGSEIRHGRT